MTELTGTQASTEDISSTGKKVLTENVEVAPPVLGRKHLLSLIKRYNKEQEKEHSSYMKRGSGKNDWYDTDTRDSLTNNVISVEKEIYKYYGKLKDASGKTLKSVGISAYDTSDPIEFVNAWMPSETVKESKPSLKGIFNSMLNENDQITIQPAKQNTQVIKQGQKTLGTVENPQLAQQIKQSIGKGEMTLAGDELQEDDMAEGLDTAQKQKLKSLVYSYRDATDPEGYSDEDPDEIIDQIRLEFGDKIADTISQGPSMHYPRPGHVDGYDRLANKSSPRVTKLGKINRQDAEAMKRTMKRQQDMTESKLNEKAVSKSQQQAAGAALAAKRGDAPKSKLKGASKEMAKMSTKELEKFAKTKHKGLPDKKEKIDEHNQVLDKSKYFDKSVKPKVGDVVIVVRAMPFWSSWYHRGDEFTVAGIYKDGWLKVKKHDPENRFNNHGVTLKHPVDADHVRVMKPTTEAAMPTHDGDFGAGLGAGRNSKTLESKKAKPDYIDLDKDGNKKESMKKAAADKQKVSTMKKTNEAKAKPDYIDLDKDGNKTEPMKKAAADKKKKAVKESANPTEAARLLGKAHAMGKDPFACKYEEGSPEAQAYLDGYKEGLDECYGSGGGMGMQQSIGMMPGMDSMVSMTDTQSPRGGSEFEIDGMDDVGGFGGFDDQPDEADMMAFEAWDRQLNELLNESKMKDIDTDMQELSDAAFKKAHGKTKAEMEKSLSGATDKKDKKPVKEGISVSVSKGQQGAPDSVSVTAQDGDADALLAMIKQAGLGLFGGEEQSGYGAPTTPQMPTNGAGDIGDHDSMMSLIKKMTTGSNDYEDEESQDDQHVHGHPDAACDTCGSSDCGCDDESDSKALVVGEDETEDQMEFEVAEANAPDSDQAETTADEDAEAEEDKALAQAAQQNKTDTFNEGGDGGEASEEDEELTEWANDAGYTGSENTKDNTFEEDIDFMTRVISGGLNGPKKDQTTLPHTRVKVDESIQALNEWKKLSGI